MDPRDINNVARHEWGEARVCSYEPAILWWHREIPLFRLGQPHSMCLPEPARGPQDSPAGKS